MYVCILGMSVIRGTFLQNMRTLKARNMRKNMRQNMRNITKYARENMGNYVITKYMR